MAVRSTRNGSPMNSARFAIACGRRRRAGVTLLELILALALTVILLGAMTMAIQMNLRSLDSRRSSVEEAQLARAVLRMISEDIRTAVQYEPQDFSAVEKMIENTISSQVSSAAGAIGSAASVLGGASGGGIVPGGGIGAGPGGGRGGPGAGQGGGPGGRGGPGGGPGGGSGGPGGGRGGPGGAPGGGFAGGPGGAAGGPGGAASGAADESNGAQAGGGRGGAGGGRGGGGMGPGGPGGGQGGGSGGGRGGRGGGGMGAGGGFAGGTGLPVNGGGSGGAGAVGGSGGTGAGGTGAGGTGSGLGAGGAAGDEGGSELTAPENIAESALPTSAPGLFGNKSELQLDVSRLPRLEQYQKLVGGVGSVTDLPSDLKTVAYYVRGPAAAPPDTGFAPQGTLTASDSMRAGLVRRELDRAVTQYATEQGRMEQVNQQGELIAPEVVGLEFRYFDGSQWMEFWDSQQIQGLPLAVEITVAIQPGIRWDGVSQTTPTAAPGGGWGFGFGSGNAAAAPPPPKLYRQVVRLAAARPNAGMQSTTGGSTDDSASGTSAGGTSAGGTSAGGAGGGTSGGASGGTGP